MNSLFRLLFIIAVAFGMTTCSNTLQKKYVNELSVIDQNKVLEVADKRGGRSICNDRYNYIPDTNHLDFTPEKIIKVNVHFMLAEGVDNNFTGEKGRKFAKNMIYSANTYLKKNLKMHLPVGNDTPQLPVRYKYQIAPNPDVAGDDGIYFHRDNDLYFTNSSKSRDRNIGDRRVYQKYGVKKGEILNIFMTEYPLDSMDSRTFKKHVQGIAFGNWVKVLGAFHSSKDTVFTKSGYPLTHGLYSQYRNLNHEIGHCLGMAHSWLKNDGCEDTPSHANCWSMNGRPPCDLPKTSNNMMDYCPVPQAITPCQIGTAHMTMSNKNKRVRGCLKKTWCDFRKSKTIEIDNFIEWNASKDIQGHVVIKDNARLILRCRLALPKGAKIIVHPKGELVLDGATLENDCGEEWEGIEVWKYGNHQGKVTYLSSPTINNARNPVKVL